MHDKWAKITELIMEKEMKQEQEIKELQERVKELEKDLHMLQRHYDQLNKDTEKQNPLTTKQIMNLWIHTVGGAEALQGIGEEVNLPKMFASAIEEMHGIKE